MEQQVIICDEYGDKVGITFKRRAKQLVIKNRAYWVDGEHTAICLITPDSKEEKKVEKPLTNNQVYEVYETSEEDDTREKDKLYRLAYRRVTEKKKLKRNLLIYAGAFFVSFLLIDAWYYNDFLQGFLIGCLCVSGLLLIRRIAVYFKPYFSGVNFLSFINRSDRDRIELEYRRLKKIDPEKASKIYSRY